VTIRTLVRAALAAVCVAGAVACAVSYVSVERFARALDTFLHTGDNARVLREVRASDSPLDPTAYREANISVALMALGRRAEAERVATSLSRREPQNAQTWLTLARIQVTRGRTRAATASWARARRLDPHLRSELPPPLRLPTRRG
jgi:cytochrome c-type biogenesis protein CcmH/NrfG